MKFCMGKLFFYRILELGQIRLPSFHRTYFLFGLRRAGLFVSIHFSSIHLLLPPTKEEVTAFTRVCLSVCLLARLLKNVCMDLDEMLRVDRCRDMDELINFCF